MSSYDETEFISTMYNYYLDDLDDDEEDVLITRSAALNRDRAAAHDRLVHDYFADDWVYDLDAFKRRFRVSRHIFLRIINALESRYKLCIIYMQLIIHTQNIYTQCILDIVFSNNDLMLQVV